LASAAEGHLLAEKSMRIQTATAHQRSENGSVLEEKA
jgi:hypothetical protein